MTAQELEQIQTYLACFAPQLAWIAVARGLNTWNDKDFQICMIQHQNTAKWN